MHVPIESGLGIFSLLHEVSLVAMSGPSDRGDPERASLILLACCTHRITLLSPIPAG